MDLSFDVEQLLSEIEARPILWDYSDELFNNREKSKEAWVDVGRNVIRNFETLKYAKQVEYLDQTKRKYYALRAAYRLARKKGQPSLFEKRFSFLDRVLSLPPSADNSGDAGESSDGELAKTYSSQLKKEAFAIENDHSAVTLKPVLSIKKIDSALVNKTNRSKRGRPPSRQKAKSPKPLKRTTPSKPTTPKRPTRPAKPVVHAEQPIVDSDVDSKEEASSAKRYRYEVEMPGTQESAPAQRSSTYASLSIEEDRQSTDRRIVPSHSYEYSERPSHRYDSHDRHDSYDRAHNYDMYDRRDRGYSPPPQMRRQESYFDACRYPMIPYPAVPLDYHDEDMAFFRSLLTWTKRFSEEEKLEFRSEVMRLVTRMRSFESTGDYYVLSQTPLS